ncbi:MAG: tetratricopeptide repeat protein [Candidatus Hydrogenedentota bacterium]
MMIAPRPSKIQWVLWIAALGLFGLLSITGLSIGPELVHSIAVRFHENNVATAMEAEDFPVAAKQLKAWLWIEPDNEAVALQLAEGHLLLGEWMEARDLLELLSRKMSPDDYTISRLMSLVKADAESPEALVWAKRAADTAPTDRSTEVALLTAHAARKSGDTEKAQALY